MQPMPQEPYQKKKPRRKGLRRLLVLVLAVLVMLGGAWGITSLIQGSDDNASPVVFDPKSQTGASDAGADGPQGGISSQPDTSLPGGEASPGGDPGLTVDNTAWDFLGEVSTEPLNMTAPDYRMIALPENGRVDMSYFDTTVFVGDSITQGLQIYRQGIPNANYCAYLGASPKAIYDGSLVKRRDGTMEVPMDALLGYQPDNVYILLGTNAMVAMGDEALLTYYSTMLDTMKERLDPAVNIYVQSITPVLQGVDKRFDMERINSLNNQLAKMAWEKDLYFVNLNEALMNDEGWLRKDFGASKDGYHLNPAGYTAWVDYLVTHTVYNPRHAHLYQADAAAYSQQPLPQ